MGKTFLPLQVYIITSLLHILWGYIFIIILALDVRGAALANTITYVLNTILMYLITVKYKDIEDSLFFDLKETFSGWMLYMKIAIPSALLFCMKNWALQILTFMSGLLDVNNAST
jgi:MATE family multidrug resistance protein